MLTGRALDTGAADCEPCLLRTGNLFSPFVKVLFDKAECRFIRNGCNGAGLENMGRAEKLFGIFMRPCLIFAGEVEVDIGAFVALETKEGFKRNVVTVALHRCSAFRTVLFRKVIA